MKDGRVLVGAGAGIGLTAKSIEAGGGDLIVIYNSGRYRMAGRGSLAGLMPYGEIWTWWNGQGGPVGLGANADVYGRECE